MKGSKGTNLNFYFMSDFERVLFALDFFFTNSQNGSFLFNFKSNLYALDAKQDREISFTTCV